MAQSRNRIVKAAAEIEATIGTNPDVDPSADGFLLFTNGNPVALDTNFVDTAALRESYTPSKGAVGRQLTRFNPSLFVMGSGSAGTAVRFNDLLRSCALTETVDAGSSVEYKPRTNGLETSSIEISLDGVMWELNAAMGTFTMSGQAGQPVDLTFDLQGLYNVPVNEPGDFSTWAGGTNLVQTLKSANFIIDNGTTIWSSSNPVGEELVVKSFNFDRGAVVGERTDANATDGLAGLNIESATPRLQVVVEAKDTVTGLPTIFADLTNATTHDVSWQIGSGAGSIWTVQCPEAQLQNVTPGDADGGTRAYTMDYLIQHTTDGEEFIINTK